MARHMEVIEMLYYNGDEVQAPVLTEAEKELVRKLKGEWFGDGDNFDMISVDPEDEIGSLGYQIMENVEWPDRKALGGVVTSLQKKRVISVTEGASRTELWFDCEALEELLGE